MTIPLRIGIDLGGTKIEGIVLDGSREAARLRVATPRDDYPATLAAVADLVLALERGTRAGATVGVGIPGVAAPDTGLVKNANSTWLIGLPLQGDLERLLGRRIRLANDANCFAMSEAADGAGAGAAVVFGVIVGTGVGAGIVVHGHLLVGPNAIAGEWGHNPLPWPDPEEWPGPPCYCGKTGCVETFLSGPGFSRDYEQRSGRREPPARIVERASAGDPHAAEALARYEDRMARALAAVINVLDPDVIVLGGGMSNVPRLYQGVPERWGAWVFGATSRRAGPAPEARPGTVSEGRPLDGEEQRPRTRLVRARHGDSSGVRGAAWLWPGSARESGD